MRPRISYDRTAFACGWRFSVRRSCPHAWALAGPFIVWPEINPEVICDAFCDRQPLQCLQDLEPARP